MTCSDGCVCRHCGEEYHVEQTDEEIARLRERVRALESETKEHTARENKLCDLLSAAKQDAANWESAYRSAKDVIADSVPVARVREVLREIQATGTGEQSRTAGYVADDLGVDLDARDGEETP